MISAPRAANSEESLSRYLAEISAFPLIDRETEVCLARRIRAGDDEAFHELVRANLRFVVAVAKRYRNQGLPLADLINEGNLGLLRAARRFDETRGIKFISYAVWWIRQAVSQAIAEQGRVVRVPPSRSAELKRIGRRTAQLSQEIGREPTAREIAADLGLDEADLAAALLVDRQAASLDAPVLGGEGVRLLDTLVDTASLAPDDQAHEETVKAVLRGAMSQLSEREARVLRLYYGVDEPEPLTLEAIGALLGITRERVRQIRDMALLRLRQNPCFHVPNALLS